MGDRVLRWLDAVTDWAPLFLPAALLFAVAAG